MIALVEHHSPAIADACRPFGVQSLDVFGSAADGTFDPSHSDIDFLVAFDPQAGGSLFHRYFDLQEVLEQLFGRKVDLMSAAALSNPFFIDAVNRSCQPIYAAPRTQTA